MFHSLRRVAGVTFDRRLGVMSNHSLNRVYVNRPRVSASALVSCNG